MTVGEFTAGHGTDSVDIMCIIGSGVLKAGKENAAYSSYPSTMEFLDAENLLNSEFDEIVSSVDRFIV